MAVHPRGLARVHRQPLVEVAQHQLPVLEGERQLAAEQHGAVLVAQDRQQHAVGEVHLGGEPVDVEEARPRRARAVLQHVAPPLVPGRVDAHVVRHEVDDVAHAERAERLDEPREAGRPAELRVDRVVVGDVVAVRAARPGREVGRRVAVGHAEPRQVVQHLPRVLEGERRVELQPVGAERHPPRRSRRRPLDRRVGGSGLARHDHLRTSAAGPSNRTAGAPAVSTRTGGRGPDANAASSVESATAGTPAPPRPGRRQRHGAAAAEPGDHGQGRAAARRERQRHRVGVGRGRLERHAGRQGRLEAPERQQRLRQAPRRRRARRRGAPPSPAGWRRRSPAPAGRGSVARTAGSANAREAAELAAPTLGDQPSQRLIMVREEEERRRRRPFLPHEEQRRLGRGEQQRQRRAVRRRVDRVVQPVAERPVADLVVVLQADDEARAAARRRGRCRAARPCRRSAGRGRTSRRRASRRRRRSRPCSPRSSPSVSPASRRRIWWWRSSAQTASRPQPPSSGRRTMTARFRSSSAMASVRRPGVSCTAAARSARKWRGLSSASACVASRRRPSTWYSWIQCSALSMKQRAHDGAARSVEVDAAAPRVLVAVREVGRAHRPQVRAVGPEVVVDDVEDHAQPDAVRLVDQARGGRRAARSSARARTGRRRRSPSCDRRRSRRPASARRASRRGRAGRAAARRTPSKVPSGVKVPTCSS